MTRSGSPTTRPTACPRTSGAAPTWTRDGGSPRGSGPARYGSTAAAPCAPTRRSAGTADPGSAANSASGACASTSRSSTSSGAYKRSFSAERSVVHAPSTARIVKGKRELQRVHQEVAGPEVGGAGPRVPGASRTTSALTARMAAETVRAAVSGAQPPEVLLELLRRAYDDALAR